jgi:hypothetical protein
MGRTDHEQCVMRDVEEMRCNANRWLNASSSKEREKIFQEHGTRWSELWRLSYWDPTRQLVVDAMHCLLEGHAHHHFRVVLGLTSTSAATPIPSEIAFSHKFTKIDPQSGAFPDDMTSKEAKQVAAIHEILTVALGGTDNGGEVIDQKAFKQSLDELSKRLMHKNTKPLHFVFRDLQCQIETEPGVRSQKTRFFKKDWVEGLIK